MKTMLLLIMVLHINAADAVVMSWDGPAPEMNGVSIRQDVKGKIITVFVENNKVFSNVLAIEKCNYGTFIMGSGGGLDDKEKTIHTTLVALDDNQRKVYFGFGVSLNLKTNEYRLLYLDKKDTPKSLR